MTTDQSRLAKSRLAVADAFTRDRAAATKPDPHDTATWLLDELQTKHGWTPPPDPATDTPPLTGPGAPEDSPGRQAFRAARAALAQRTRDNP